MIHGVAQRCIGGSHDCSETMYVFNHLCSGLAALKFIAECWDAIINSGKICDALQISSMFHLKGFSLEAVVSLEARGFWIAPLELAPNSCISWWVRPLIKSPSQSMSECTASVLCVTSCHILIGWFIQMTHGSSCGFCPVLVDSKWRPVRLVCS